MINAARWQVFSDLFDEAQALPVSARAGWLAALTARDPDLAAAGARILAKLDAQPVGTETSPAAAFDRLLRRVLLDAPAAAAVSPGQRLGAWELQMQIGEGGMGQVWLAHRRDGLYAASAAIKLLRSDRQQAHLMARFARERAALARLNHPGIAKLLDAGVDGGQAYLVLEHVNGQMLAQHIAAACPTVASRVRLLIAVADAVAHAHGHLIVHRDIKPSNLLFTPDGAPKLLDFGVAKLLDGDDEADNGLTHQNGRMLTAGYAAPELITGAPADVAADVFSLGVLLYEMLAGCLPFGAKGSNRSALEHAVLHTEPRRLTDTGAAGRAQTQAGAISHVQGAARLDGKPAVDERTVTPPSDFARARGDLEAIIAKTLRKDPTERYGSVSALTEDLRLWLQSRPVGAQHDNLRHVAALWLRRHALASGLAIGLVVALSAGLFASVWQWQRAQASERQSEHVTDYLGGLLASASPDASQGRSPTVLELLEKSRLEVTAKFGDEPEVRMRLLEVLATTFTDLNRYDLAAPLAQQWQALGAQRYGVDDPRTLHARLMQARINVPMGPWEPVVGWLAPLQADFARVFGGDSLELHELLICLAVSEIKVGLLEAAERHLEQVRVIGERLYREGSFERDFHHNYVALLYLAQGRTGLALTELRKTSTQQQAPPADMKRYALVLRSNTLMMQIRLGDYERVEERTQALLRESDHLLGPGNALNAKVSAELARFYADRGDFAAALAERERVLSANGSGTPPAVQLANRAAVFLDRCLMQPRRTAALAPDARLIQADLERGGPALGTLGVEAWLALARSGLLLGDDALVARALATLHAHPALSSSSSLANRVSQIDGEWQRAQGNLAASRTLLAPRVAELERSPDHGVPALWASRLDLAYTLLLLHDPAAEAAVDAAAAERPRQMPAGHPLDAVLGYLQALRQQQSQRRPTPAITKTAVVARHAVEQAYGRHPGDGSSGALRLGGMFN